MKKKKKRKIFAFAGFPGDNKTFQYESNIPKLLNHGYPNKDPYSVTIVIFVFYFMNLFFEQTYVIESF